MRASDKVSEDVVNIGDADSSLVPVVNTSNGLLLGAEVASDFFVGAN